LVTTVLGRRSGAVTGAAEATFTAVRDGGGTVVGAAMRTPPQRVYLSPMPAEAAELVAAAMAASCPDAGGVAGTAAEAAAFAAAWTARTGQPLAIAMLQRIHRLDAVTMPAAPPRRWRLAEASVGRRSLGGGAAAGMLYPDLDNPTSNRIYAAVGYRPVTDVSVYDRAPDPS